MNIIRTDRSRTEQFQRCARLRYLEYHQDGRGISPARKPLALCVGGSVHVGLEWLLNGRGEDQAVAAALADFATHRSALALDLAEETALATVQPQSLIAQMQATAVELGVALDDPTVRELYATHTSRAKEFEDWLWQEQAALVEGLVRAYARRRLKPLLAEFEVLEVEREGEWELSEPVMGQDGDGPEYELAPAVWFMSRPDALLRSRSDNCLYILSFKTAASWDVRKARDAEHDAQGLSEGVEIEKRLAEWWLLAQGKAIPLSKPDISKVMWEYLSALPAPPRIMGIRYEYMLKGSRYEDKDLTSRFGVTTWAQRSHLVRAYQGDLGWCWSYEFLKEDGAASKLYYAKWRPRAIWEHITMKQWIDMLDASEPVMSAYDSTVGLEPRPLGWHSEAQAQGYTEQHPLDAIFPAPLVVYRSDDQLRDWVEQTEAQERRVAEAVAMIQSAADDGERRSLLNRHFPMARRACSYPTECSFTKVCYGGDDIRRDPLASGLYKIREVNHPMEVTGK